MPSSVSIPRRVLAWLADYLAVMIPGMTVVLLAAAQLVHGLPGFVGSVAAEKGWGYLAGTLFHTGTGGTSPASGEWISFALPLIVALLVVPLLQFAYQATMLSWRGRTIGKMLLDTRVGPSISDTERLPRGAAVRRAFLTTTLETGMVAVALVLITVGQLFLGILLWGAAILAFWVNAFSGFSTRHRTIVDRLSGTAVVPGGLYAGLATAARAALPTRRPVTTSTSQPPALTPAPTLSLTPSPTSSLVLPPAPHAITPPAPTPAPAPAAAPPTPTPAPAPAATPPAPQATPPAPQATPPAPQATPPATPHMPARQAAPHGAAPHMPAAAPHMPSPPATPHMPAAPHGAAPQMPAASDVPAEDSDGAGDKRSAAEAARAASRKASDAALAAGRATADAAAVAGQLAKESAETVMRSAPVQQALNSRTGQQAQALGAAGAEKARELGAAGAEQARKLRGKAQEMWRQRRTSRAGENPDQES